MMDESKSPPTHLGSCRYIPFYRGGFGFVHHSIAILDHEVPNLSLSIRNFCIAAQVRKVSALQRTAEVQWVAPLASLPSSATAAGDVSHWEPPALVSVYELSEHPDYRSAAQGSPTSCLNFDFAILNLFDPSAL